MGERAIETEFKVCQHLPTMLGGGEIAHQRSAIIAKNEKTDWRTEIEYSTANNQYPMKRAETAKRNKER